MYVFRHALTSTKSSNGIQIIQIILSEVRGLFSKLYLFHIYLLVNNILEILKEQTEHEIVHIITLLLKNSVSYLQFVYLKSFRPKYFYI